MTETEFMAWYYNVCVPKMLRGYKRAILDDGGTWDDLKAAFEYTLIMLDKLNAVAEAENK